MNTVSLCMIVKNEESCLARCLDSVVDLVDEVIIVDTGSDDRTVEIAKEFGAQVYLYEWKSDFSAARNESLKYASGDWIFLMDADDEFNRKDSERFKKIIVNGDSDVYYFETHSYVGERPGPNVVINLNLRLIRNNKGYFFKGAIHEQLTNEDLQIDTRIKGAIEDIKLYHYGYLQKTIKEKNKRLRNISIIESQLVEEPNNAFHIFNLANEFFAQKDYEEALMNYNRVFQKFEPLKGYSTKLVIRMALCYLFLERLDEGLDLIDRMLQLYPDLTDLEYLRGLMYHKDRKYSLAIDSFNKCLDMGEPPLNQKFIQGVEDYRVYQAFIDLYLELKDYNRAYGYCLKALQVKPDYLEPLYKIVYILKCKNVSLIEIKISVEKFFSNLPEQIPIIADLFYEAKEYDLSLNYLALYEEIHCRIPKHLRVFQCKCLLHKAKYEECLLMLEELRGSIFEPNDIKLICMILLNQKEEVYNYLNLIKEKKSLEYDDKRIDVYEAFANLMFNYPIKILSEDDEDEKYMEHIFELLDILLNNKEFDAFEKALDLLNLINNKKVLLSLGKLYNKYGFTQLAKKEIIRSIKEFDVIDQEGLEMLVHY